MSRNKGLCVVDHPYWISATIANAIKKSCRLTEIDIISVESLLDHKEMLKKVSNAVDFVHFLTPHIFPRVNYLFPRELARVTHVHHLEDDRHNNSISETDLVVTVSGQWEQVLRAQGIPENKMIRIANGVDLSVFTPQNVERKAIARARFGIDPRKKIIGFVAKKSSNTSNRKGVDTFIRLLRDLRAKRNDLGVFFLGFGWDQEVSEIRNLDIEVYHEAFLPNFLDLAAYYHSLDILCVTARIEGGPVPVFEAMACGIPTVSTPVGMVLDWVRNGESGIICDFEDTLCMSSAICSLLDDQGLYRRISDAAKEIVASRLTWEGVTQKADAMYSAALARAAERTGSAPRRQTNQELAKVYKVFLSRVKYSDQMLLLDHFTSTGNLESARALKRQMLCNPEYYRRRCVLLSTNAQSYTRKLIGKFKSLAR